MQENSQPIPQLPLTRLPLASSCGQKMEAVLRLKMEGVPQRNFLPRGLCYWNVDGLVRHHGGSTVTGWQCLWWPNHLAVAIHHAVWKKPNGDLIDVTLKENSDFSDGTSFCSDASEAVDLSWPMLIPNVFVALSDHALVGSAVIAFNEKIDAIREAVAYVKQKNGTFIPGAGLTLPSGAMPRAIQNRVRKANANHDRALKDCEELARPGA